MNNATILVLSKYSDLFASFRENVDALAPETFKILVRTGKEIKAPQSFWWLTRQGQEPFNFSRNVNMGWDAAKPDDVILVGDDVRFHGPFVEIMRDIAYSDPAIGFVVPELGGQSCFVCAYIKRELIEKVGPMDERFDGYGVQDNDYYRRYEALGYRTQPTKEVRATHTGGTSYYRTEREGGERVQDSAERMWKVYHEKWGTAK